MTDVNSIGTIARLGVEEILVVLTISPCEYKDYRASDLVFVTPSQKPSTSSLQRSHAKELRVDAQNWMQPWRCHDMYEKIEISQLQSDEWEDVEELIRSVLETVQRMAVQQLQLFYDGK